MTRRDVSSWLRQGTRVTTRDRGVFRGVVRMVWAHDGTVEFTSDRTGELFEVSCDEFVATYRPLDAAPDS